MTKSETQKYVMGLREENAKLCEENERIRQTHFSYKVYIDLLKEYVDLLEENEKLKADIKELDEEHERKKKYIKEVCHPQIIKNNGDQSNGYIKGITDAMEIVKEESKK